MRLLDEALPFRGYRNPGLWPVCARLLPHVLAATQHAAQVGVGLLTTASLLNKAADYLHGLARYADARRLQEHASAIYEDRLGPDHPTTADSLSNLATVLIDLGDLDGASRLYRRALAIHENRLGPDHPNTAPKPQQPRQRLGRPGRRG